MRDGTPHGSENDIERTSIPALIEIRDATLWRGNTRVFEHLSLRIERHEQVAIIGPNGAGKTTLLKAINREIYPVANQGSLTLLGQERWNVWELRRRLGVVSQDLQQRYLPGTPAREVVLSGFCSSIGVHGSLATRIGAFERARATAALERVGMAAHAGTPLARLSTGEQRRCLLARALVHEPVALVLDEPTAGLDLEGSFDYLARIRSLARDGVSIVLVTHHLNEIPPEIERVVVLHRGRVVADGPKAGVLRPEVLAPVYGVPLRVAEVDGYFLAYPEAGAAET
ncbi:MAG TPA: ATP-binding cassette domain-containing protein [Woeseiaceae bacterium]|nr:ATP-binding cassette domain-containing protein [Woeseiaceae bacterium]